MNRLLYRCSFLILLFCCTFGNAYSQDEIKKIGSAITDYLKSDADTAKLNADIFSLSKSIRQDGSWPDIDYASRIETGWTPLNHLNRLKLFALAIAIRDKSNPSNVKLAQQLRVALRYWLQANPRSNNWFQNDIASPTGIGEILMLTRDTEAVSPALRDSLIIRMRQGDVAKNVGSNKMDIAVHMLYRACLTMNKQVLDSAVSQAFLPITLSNKEGLQPDYSYRQHGPQLHTASYGQVFLTAEYKFASWLVGTSYALPAEKLKILDQYLINTYLKTIRGRYIDFNTEGRGISRNDLLDKENITSKYSKHSLLALAKLVSPGNAAAIAAAEQRLLQTKDAGFDVTAGHAFFYRSDYTIHTRPGYSFNVRTVSRRTIRTETGNKENLLGKFLPDGATNIQRRGGEYYNIMPVWEWDKIPGITARDYPEDQKTTLEWGERGVGDFTGGLSDGKYGASVYQFDYNEVTAKKAWFFFDQEIVCLGAAINSFAREPITTTVNQAWQKGAVKVWANNTGIALKDAYTSNTISAIWHDSIGYYFPKAGNVHVTAGKQMGKWVNINANRSKDLVTGNVFKVWFDHGTDPVAGSYAYIVRPGISEKEMMDGKPSAVTIVANTALMQAVLNEELQMLQVVFYEAGTLKTGDITVSVDKPCILQVRDLKSSNPILSLSDPTQKLSDVYVSFSSGRVKTVDPRSVSLPQGDHKGATVTVPLNEGQ